MRVPKLTVVVCTYNREKYIGECMSHLTKQTVDKGLYEILIINNNSTDRTESVIENVIKQNTSVDFRYFVEKNQGHTYSRNHGIRESKGEIIAFIDDDAFVHKDYCQAIISFFEQNPTIMAIGGRIVPVYEDEEPKWLSKYLLPLVAALDMGDQPKAFKGNKFPIGANMAFRKSAFEIYGIFDTDLGRRGSELEGGDEKEMFSRLRKGGEKVFYVPEVCVEHIIPPHRLEESYIKGLAIGVGKSERKRMGKYGFWAIMNKFLDEAIKTAGTFILAAVYILQGQHFSKSSMLIKFRIWVISSLIFKKR